MATWNEEVGKLNALSPADLTPTKPPRVWLDSPVAEHKTEQLIDSFDSSNVQNIISLSPPPKASLFDAPQIASPTKKSPPPPLLLSNPKASLPPFLPTHRRTRTDVLTPTGNILRLSDPPVHLHSRVVQGQFDSKAAGNVFFNGLFHGESAPIRLGIAPSDKDSTFEVSPMARSRSLSPTKMAASSPLKNLAYSNPFSFFSGKSQREQPHTLPEPADDELLNLDINASLFGARGPNISTEEELIDFQRNAEALVRQMQNAYKLRTFALHQALAEKVQQKEELEETQSRLYNMKCQLDGMAARVVEQDQEMKAMAEELKLERQKRQQEDEARRRSATIINSYDSFNNSIGAATSLPSRHTKQLSSGASASGDSGFESADESIAESIFSKRTEDTTLTRPASVISTNSDCPAPPLIATQSAHLPSAMKSRTVTQTRPSAYDRVFKGITAAGSSLTGLTASKCPNCHGAKLPDPGHVAAILQQENRVLKTRISELEDAVEECISLVGG
ncbi:hypothetical protein LOZ66_000716 [Ophidiomyces ophidiicola]|nr:hypothetical protein LOZ66_000716 [Ophidiomyces ophidiicola]